MAGPCVQDTASVILTTPGTPRQLRADVALSPDAGQSMSLHANGLYAPTLPGNIQSAGQVGYSEGGFAGGDTFVISGGFAVIEAFTFIPVDFTHCAVDTTFMVTFGGPECVGFHRPGQAATASILLAEILAVRTDGLVLGSRQMRGVSHAWDGTTPPPIWPPLTVAWIFQGYTNLDFRFHAHVRLQASTVEAGKKLDGASYATSSLAWTGVAAT